MRFRDSDDLGIAHCGVIGAVREPVREIRLVPALFPERLGATRA